MGHAQGTQGHLNVTFCLHLSQVRVSLGVSGINTPSNRELHQGQPKEIQVF